MSSFRKCDFCPNEQTPLEKERAFPTSPTSWRTFGLSIGSSRTTLDMCPSCAEARGLEARPESPTLEKLLHEYLEDYIADQISDQLEP